MTIEKLPSGSWRIVEMVDGKRYRVTVKDKPTKADARTLIQEQIVGFHNSTSFGTAADNYIKSKQNVLSPSTIRGYRQMMNGMSRDFLNTPIDKIDAPFFQRYINEFSINHAPKTVKNVSGFIGVVLKFYGAKVQSPTLPKKIKEPDYIPTKEDVQRLLEEIKGSKYEVPIILATLGLRRSEIFALTKDDLNGNTIIINKAIVEDENKEWQIKTTKTLSSTRTIMVPDYVADLIRKNGIYDGSPHSVYNALKRYQQKLGIQHFSFHKFRHFFASYMHDLGYTDKQIQEFGGWKTDAIMKSVYQHAMDMDKIKQNMADNIGGLLK